MEETSLSDFVGTDAGGEDGDAADGADSDGTVDDAEDLDAPVGGADDTDPLDAPVDDVDAIDAAPTSDAVDPARTTAAWRPEGGDCEACGASAPWRWREDEALVCPACKSWEA